MNNFGTINKIIQHHSIDKAQENDSKTSTSSRKDSIENVIANLTEVNSLKK